MGQPLEFSAVFVPFMIGALSLVGFLSLRNAHLSKNVRDLCSRIRDERDSFWEASLTLQLACFVRRYMWSNRALAAAIGAIFMFGAMIGCVAVTTHKISTDIIREFPLAMLVVGGALGTFATAVSIYETFVARQSLTAEVAATIIRAEYTGVEPSLHSTLGQIERDIRRSLDKELHGRLMTVLENLRRDDDTVRLERQNMPSEVNAEQSEQ